MGIINEITLSIIKNAEDGESIHSLASKLGFAYSAVYRWILELEKKVPIFNLNVEFMIDSPYSGNATGLKNCYLCFNSNHSEDCMYGNAVDQCKDCIDNSHISHSERCYESFWLQNCYQCYFTKMSADSRNLWFCRDCVWM